MKTLTIRATTTDSEIKSAISYLDMRREAIERRDDAAVLAEQGDQVVLELHSIDGVDVLYSPIFGYALVNAASTGIGDSLLISNGDCESPEAAAECMRAA